MSHRSNHLSVYVILIGMLVLSASFNILQYKQIKMLQYASHNNWVTIDEYEKIRQEIERLEKNPFGVK